MRSAHIPFVAIVYYYYESITSRARDTPPPGGYVTRRTTATAIPLGRFNYVTSPYTRRTVFSPFRALRLSSVNRVEQSYTTRT